jgi:CRP/FNR family cyclic AMP-dependent transcriptional regulator
MITLAKLMFLRRFPFFERMSSKVLGLVASIAEEVVFPAGARIFDKGDPGDSMFLIVEGQVRIHVGDTQLSMLGAAEPFGEMGVLDGEPRSAAATAVSDCLLLRIRKDDFHRILFRSPEASLAVLKTLCLRLRAAEQRHYGWKS